MNRAEKRRLAKEQAKKDKVINIKVSEIEKIKKDAVKQATDEVFLLMLGLPAMVLHDKYSQIMKREVDGKGRVERFIDLVLELYQDFSEGYFTLEEVKEVLEEECGMEITGIKRS